MKKPIIIGKHTFKYKKDALKHFKKILNSYDSGETLSKSDFNDVSNLLNSHENVEKKSELELKRSK